MKNNTFNHINLHKPQRMGGYKKLYVNNKLFIVRFDKIDRIYDFEPRINDMLNVYRGRQRNSLPQIIEHLKSINYGKEATENQSI